MLLSIHFQMWLLHQVGILWFSCLCPYVQFTFYLILFSALVSLVLSIAFVCMGVRKWVEARGVWNFSSYPALALCWSWVECFQIAFNALSVFPWPNNSFIKEYLGAPVGVDIEEMKSTMEKQKQTIEKLQKELDALKAPKKVCSLFFPSVFLLRMASLPITAHTCCHSWSTPMLCS